jgi:hypothetical protein
MITHEGDTVRGTTVIWLWQYMEHSVWALASFIPDPTTHILPNNILFRASVPTASREFFAQRYNQENIWSRVILISTDFYHTTASRPPLVSNIYLTIGYITIFTDLVTLCKFCEFLTHTSTTSHHSGILSVLWQLALPWDTTHSSNKQNSFVKTNWLECEAMSTWCEGKVYLHSVFYACTVWDLGKVCFYGFQCCCENVCLATSSHKPMYIQTRTNMYLPSCWWLLNIGITTYKVLLKY